MMLKMANLTLTKRSSTALSVNLVSWVWGKPVKEMHGGVRTGTVSVSLVRVFMTIKTVSQI